MTGPRPRAMREVIAAAREAVPDAELTRAIGVLQRWADAAGAIGCSLRTSRGMGSHLEDSGDLSVQLGQDVAWPEGEYEATAVGGVVVLYRAQTVDVDAAMDEIRAAALKEPR